MDNPSLKKKSFMTAVALEPMTETFLCSLEILNTGQCVLPSSIISHTTGIGFEVEQRLSSSKKLVTDL